jgi:hypothetical protein
LVDQGGGDRGHESLANEERRRQPEGDGRVTRRHEFVPAAQRAKAYLDMALPIGEAQTISGPLVVAVMTEQLRPQPGDRVLEIGTGSGV